MKKQTRSLWNDMFGQKVVAPAVSRWQENIGLTIDTLLTVYARRTPPAQLRKFAAFLAGVRASSRTNGWSPAKQFLLYGHCPRKIYYMMVRLFGVEWRNKPDVNKAFWDRARAFRIRPHGGLPMTRPEWAMEDRDFSCKKTTEPSPSTCGPQPTWRTHHIKPRSLPVNVYGKNTSVPRSPAS